MESTVINIQNTWPVRVTWHEAGRVFFNSVTHFYKFCSQNRGELYSVEGPCQKSTTLHCSKTVDQLWPHLTIKPPNLYIYETWRIALKTLYRIPSLGPGRWSEHNVSIYSGSNPCQYVFNTDTNSYIFCTRCRGVVSLLFRCHHTCESL